MRRKVVQIEEVVSVAAEDMPEEQYFVLYGKEEGEAFAPDRVFGLWGARMAAHVVSRFRQTGLLLRPGFRWMGRQDYEVIEGVLWMYVLKPTDMLSKRFHYQEMSQRAAEEYKNAQMEKRKSVEQYKEDPE